ncbi:glycosyltransferase family 9 protein [bacterium]|nr:glycosyltransferase family 9 protein [bacterium]
MKLIVVRFSSIGDIVLTSPVVRCLKDQLSAEVHYLTKNSFSTLVEHNPYIDKVFGIDSEISEVTPSLKQENYDYIIDLHKNIRSFRLKKALGVKSINFTKLNVKKWLFTTFKVDLLPKKHLVDRYFDSLVKLGVLNDGKGLDYFYPKETKAPEHWNLTSGHYNVIAIGGTYLTKRLTNEQIVSVIKRLKTPSVLIGGVSDQNNANEIWQGTEKACINLCGVLSLNESARLIDESNAVLCHDSGMMHIAAAFNKPVIAVWGNTHPKFGMYAYVRANNPSEVFNMEVNLSCRPCSKLGHENCPKGHFKCIKMQNVDEIVKNCNSIEPAQ